jgi:hypothetical protein
VDPERVERIEKDLEELQSVQSARIRVDGQQIQEVHIVASTSREAKGVVRDVVTALFAKHGIRLNFRKVSVALMGETDADGEPHRVEFLSVNTLLQGTRVEAQVELSWPGGTLLGSRTGPNTPESRLRLIGEATIEALQQATREGCQWSLADVTSVRLGQSESVAAKVLLLEGRRRLDLSGCALVQSYADEAVVFAVLQATNRVASRLLKEVWQELEIAPEPGSQGQEGAGPKEGAAEEA